MKDDKTKSSWEILLALLCSFVMLLFMFHLIKEQGKISHAEELLYKKYGEHFEIKRCDGSCFSSSNYSVTVYSPEYNTLFEAEVYQNKVSDEYVSARVRKKIENQLNQSLQSADFDYFIKVKAISDSIDSDNADMSIEEFLQIKPSDKFVVYLFYNDTNSVSVCSALSDSLSKMNYLNGSIVTYNVSNSQLKKIKAYFSKEDEIYKDFEKIISGSYKETFEFSNGTILF